MPFTKVETKVNFAENEGVILSFWQKHHVFGKLCAKNRGRPKWSFLDGPITANNPMGVHHAWGRTYKDAFQRYFSMTGHELRYQNGFDCQGLWVEVEVEKELGLQSKRQIENLVVGDRFASIDYFVQLCKQRVDRFARIQTEQSIRLGYWMDWDTDEDWQHPPEQRRSYFTMSERNNYTIWGFLKKCHQRHLIYRAYDAMPWCPRCGVGISQQEMHEGYVRIAHRAVFVRFPLRDRPGENILVWTTTPWTLTSNVAAAVNPQLAYIKVLHREQIYYLAKGALTARRLEEEFKRKEWVEGVPKLKTLEQIFKEKGGYEVLGEISGADMVGWTYDGPFDELPAQMHPGGYPVEIADAALKQQWTLQQSAKDAHRVIAWDIVDEKEGTGIVHIAPGCGKEDFQLGRKENLPPVAPLDEEGNFLSGFGELEGKFAVDHETTDWIVDTLKHKGLLLDLEQYPHSYPHCWRCKAELLFRLVDEWFIDMNWREEIMRILENVTFLPSTINGKARELDWLRNMGDWMISKKRFWGLALPIWTCESCGTFEVLGGHEELRRRAIEGWEKFEGHSPHRPWIDVVKIQCANCGSVAHRIPDVGNPWLDAGIVPYSTLDYPSEYWKEWFPADFITECFPGQFRNWFYSLLAMSTMMSDHAPFKVLLGHALVRDERGEEMHKSKGNAIAFNEAAEDMGADVCRWLYCRHNPAININFGVGPADDVRSKFILKLWNTYAFLCNYARLDNFDPAAPQVPVKDRPDIDQWVLSDLQLLIRNARLHFESFNVMSFCLEVERFVDEKLSNWYVRRNRRRFWKSELSSDKLAAYQTLYSTVLTLTKLVAPIIPFLTETMFQNLRTADAPESVHLCDYPEVDEQLINDELSENIEILLRTVSLGLSVRNTAKIKIRQPLSEMKISPANGREKHVIERFGEQIAEELNLKQVTVHDPKDGPLLTSHVSLNLKKLGPKLGSRLKDAQLAIAAADPREITRKTQSGEVVELSGASGLIALEPDDFLISVQVPEGRAGLEDGGTQILLDIRISQELKDEGIARDIVRYIQELRKQSALEMEDRIELYLNTNSSDILGAIDIHRDYIANETLVQHWASQPFEENGYKTAVKMYGYDLIMQLRRMDSGKHAF